MPLLLSLILTLSALLPFTVGPASPFFNIDPDVVYVTNALSFIVRRQIPYVDHPGTPYILTLAASYTPLRFYAKYISRLPFIDWSLTNFRWLMAYSRGVAVLIFSLGMFVYLSAIWKLTRSNLSLIVALSMLMSYSPTLFYFTRVIPENFLLITTAIWVWLLFYFLEHPTWWRFALWGLTAVLSLAAKLTSLPQVLIVFFTGFLLLFISAKKTLLYLIFSVFFCGMGFLVFTWPVRHQYPQIISWSRALAGHTGVYGTGKQTWFDYNTILASSQIIYRSEPSMVNIFLLTPLVFLVVWPNLKSKNRSVIGGVILVTEVFAVLFAKYPNPHYLFSIWLILIVVLLYLINSSKSHIRVLLVLFILLTLFIPATVINYNRYISFHRRLFILARMEQFISDHPPRIMTLWEYGDTKDFSLLWGRSWSGEFYGTQLSQIYPKLGEMISLTNYRNNTGQISDLYSVCWDQLYLRTLLVGKFMSTHAGRYFVISATPDPEMVLITSNHCSL